MVLGNHDLHLLAVGCGEGTLKRSDTVEPILTHPDSHAMLDWLRHQPLLVRGDRHVMVHAGILPQWSVDKAESLAREAEDELQGKKYRKFFGKMYGNKPTEWTDDLTGYERLRMIINVFTRMRALTYKGELDYEYKSTLKKMPLYLRPWFKAPDRQNLDILPCSDIGRHWATLIPIRYRFGYRRVVGWRADSGQFGYQRSDTGTILGRIGLENGIEIVWIR